MSELTLEQRLAVEANGAVCLTASAGSGKTRVLVERYVRLLEEGHRPDQILMVTFTRKAGQQLKDRISERLSEAPPALRESIAQSPWIGTLHAFCLQVVRQWGFLLQREAMARLLDTMEWTDFTFQVRKQWLKGLTVDSSEALFEYWTPHDLEAMAQEVLARPTAFAAATDRFTGEDRPTRVAAETFRPLCALLAEHLESRGVSTFDALENDALRLLRDFPAARTHYQHAFRAILVDEFQDTSPTQWALLENLIGEQTHKLFVVGDPKQSIYRFRHADVRLFHHWNTHLQETGGHTLDLRTCFRSSPELVGRINGFSEALFAGSPLADQSMEAGRLQTDRPPIQTHRFSGDDAKSASENERRLAARTVRALLDSGVPAEETALLFRNGDRLDAFAQELSALGIPVACEPVTALFDQYVARDLAAYLRAVFKPLDGFLLSAFLRTPYGGFSPADLAALQSRIGDSLFEKLLLAGQLSWFVALVEKGECRTQKILEALFEGGRRWPAKGTLLWQMLGGLARTPFLGDAVARLDAWESEGVQVQTPLDGHDTRGVRLMTVHGSKGLEFQEVLLVDLLRRPPSRQPWFVTRPDAPLGVRSRQGGEIIASPEFEMTWEKEKSEEAAEARRILYVALTRAKDRVHFFLPENAKLIPKNAWAELLESWSKN